MTHLDHSHLDHSHLDPTDPFMPLSSPLPLPNPVAVGRGTKSRHVGAATRYAQDGTQVVSPNRLVVLLYERLLKDLDAAAVLLEDGRSAHAQLIHAQDVIDALDLSLDVSEWSGGPGLRSIYEHCHRELVSANLEGHAGRVRQCREVLAPLAGAWALAAAEAASS